MNNKKDLSNKKNLPILFFFTAVLLLILSDERGVSDVQAETKRSGILLNRGDETGRQNVSAYGMDRSDFSHVVQKSRNKNIQ